MNVQHTRIDDDLYSTSNSRINNEKGNENDDNKGGSYQNNKKKSEISSISKISKNQKELKDGIIGLKNNNLYCYMNSCLQCLLPIDELRDYYLSKQF